MRRAVAFGPFQFDQHTLELRNGGLPVKVRRQSLEVLAVLVEHAGELVTRDALRNRLWPGAKYGDFDSGLNSAVNRLRAALNDCGSERSRCTRTGRCTKRYPDRAMVSI